MLQSPPTQMFAGVLVWDHPLSTYAKFSEKLTLLTPRYAHVRVRIRRLEMLVFRKVLRTYLIDGPLPFEKMLNILYTFFSIFSIRFPRFCITSLNIAINVSQCRTLTYFSRICRISTIFRPNVFFSDSCSSSFRLRLTDGRFRTLSIHLTPIFWEAVAQKWSVKKMFMKISQNSQ